MTQAIRVQAVEPADPISGKKMSGPELLKHHLAIYERIFRDPDPKDVPQMLQLAAALQADVEVLVIEARAVRRQMLAQMLGVAVEGLTDEHVDQITEVVGKGPQLVETR